MITEETARDMMKKLSTLYKKAEKTKRSFDRMAHREYESECLNTFRYFVLGKTGRYRKFANYEDLTQEAMEALLKAMKTFKENKGSFFFWAGLFVKTRVSRSANNHSVIRYPMHVAKDIKPHKESSIPTMIATELSPEETCEGYEVRSVVSKAVHRLPSEEKEIVSLLYGFETGTPISISKICKQKKMSRGSCLKILGTAFETLRDQIEV